jgi:hypothetical protein
MENQEQQEPLAGQIVPMEEVSLEMLRYKEDLLAKLGLPSNYAMGVLKQVCADMVASGLVPSCFKGNPMGVFLAVLRGQEMGIGPTEAVMETFFAAPGGRLGMYAQKMLDLLHRGGVKSEFITETKELCEILFTPPSPHVPYLSAFTIEEARTAGLVKADSNWIKWPKAMLRARAISVAYRLLSGTFGRGGANLYSKEELDDMPVSELSSTVTVEDAAKAFVLGRKSNAAAAATSSTVDSVEAKPE